MKDLLAYPFYAMGWIVGYTAKVARLTWAAIAEGYSTGRRL
jgi:hypothetical protein